MSKFINKKNMPRLKNNCHLIKHLIKKKKKNNLVNLLYTEVTILKKKLRAKQRTLFSLEQQNSELSSELNNTKMLLKDMHDQNSVLMAENIDLFINKEKSQQVRDYIDKGITSALRLAGSFSEILLRIKQLSQLKTTNTKDSSGEVTTDQALFNPIIESHKLLYSDHISAHRKVKRSRNSLCPPLPSIQEEPSTPPQPIRTRLGCRNQPSFSVKVASPGEIPEVDSETSLRLLSNTSRFKVASPEEVEAASPEEVEEASPVEEIPEADLESSLRLLSNLSRVNLNYSEEAISENNEASVRSSLTNNSSVPVQQSSEACLLIPTLLIDNPNIITLRKRKQLVPTNETYVLSPNNNLLQQSNIARPSNNETIEVDRKVVARSHKRSTCRKSSVKENNSTYDESESQSSNRRISSRAKKVVKYLDEPFSQTELKRILKKGRK